AVGQEVGEADVVLEGDAEPEAAHTRPLRLFADHHVEAEVLRACAAVGLRDRHPEESAASREREHPARDDPRALPFAVAALLADHLALEEGAKAGAEVLVHLLEQRAPHAARSILPGLASSSCTSRIRRSRNPP